MMKLAVVLISLAAMQCDADDKWINYVEIGVYGDQRQPEAREPKIRTIRINANDKSIMLGNSDLLDTWEQCESGWDCIVSSKLIFARERSKRLENAQSWTYAGYSFVVAALAVDARADARVLISVSEAGKPVGLAIYSESRGIVGFATVSENSRIISAYWLVEANGVFASK
jgi:hypothetical protein